MLAIRHKMRSATAPRMTSDAVLMALLETSKEKHIDKLNGFKIKYAILTVARCCYGTSRFIRKKSCSTIDMSIAFQIRWDAFFLHLG
jgi:hypothetical protein